MDKANRESYHWASWGHTSILLKLDTSGGVPEWQPVGRLVLRKIYDEQPKEWYAYLCGRDLAPDTLLGRFSDWLDAQSAVEKSTGGT